MYVASRSVISINPVRRNPVMYKQALKRIELWFGMCGYICISCKIALGYISIYLYISMQHMQWHPLSTYTPGKSLDGGA